MSVIRKLRIEIAEEYRGRCSDNILRGQHKGRVCPSPPKFAVGTPMRRHLVCGVHARGYTNAIPLDGIDVVEPAEELVSRVLAGSLVGFGIRSVAARIVDTLREDGRLKGGVNVF
jgi:hypothetical protein